MVAIPTKPRTTTPTRQATHPRDKQHTHATSNTPTRQATPMRQATHPRDKQHTLATSNIPTRQATHPRDKQHTHATSNTPSQQATYPRDKQHTHATSNTPTRQATPMRQATHPHDKKTAENVPSTTKNVGGLASESESIWPLAKIHPFHAFACCFDQGAKGRALLAHHLFLLP